MKQVVEVRCKSDHIISIRLMVGSEFIAVASVHASQIALEEDTKRLFWEDLVEEKEDTKRQNERHTLL